VRAKLLTSAYLDRSFRYRRIFFVGIIPLLSTNKLERCAIGLTTSIMSMVLYRELRPFALDETSKASFFLLLAFAVDDPEKLTPALS
jgi:hypothetical protein